MQATIEVSGLRKRFGPALALDGMTFTVRPGRVTGFVGPNEAGKSTTMRVILGLDAPDAGSALVAGKPYARIRRPMSLLGSLLDAAALQPSRSARNHLLWLAHSQGLTAKRVDEVIEQAGLVTVARRRAGGYSLGMRQRLGIAAAMLGNPAAIMLDEPFNGMDPEGIVWMRQFLRSLAAQGRTVLVSSHLMSELQDTADHLVIAGRGKVIADTTVASLLAAASGDRVTLRTAALRRRRLCWRPRGPPSPPPARTRLLSRPAGRADHRVAQRAGSAVLGGGRPPRHAGAGLHGADQGGGRVPSRRSGHRSGRGGRAMTTGTVSVRHSRSAAGADAGRAGFGPLLRSEWTKFRTVRGWVIGVFLAALLIVLVGLFAAGNGSNTCQTNGGPVLSGKACLPYIPHGPGGEVVTDSFNFAHQPLTGNGSITVRVLSLSGAHPDLGNASSVPAGGSGPAMTPGLMPWSKAGIIIKQNARQGSAYAAMMVTGSNGVRMQYDYTGDIAGLPGSVSAAHPRWLRLTRAGDTITGYDSADGTQWTKVGTVQLTGLPATVQVGMFATSPNYTQTSTSFGGSSNQGAPSQATGVFGDVTASGTPGGGPWAAAAVGGGGPISGPGVPAGQGGPGTGARGAGFTHTGRRFTVTGSGDIAPVVPGAGSGLPTATIEQSLAGAFIGLIAIVVVAAMFVTAEYRRGLIRTTLAATPRRGQVLAAKAIVAAAVAFAVGLAASVAAVSFGVPLERNNGSVVLAVSALTEVRVVVGTAAMLAVAAAFAVGLGAMLRRSAAAITIAVATVVLPFLLSAFNILPSGPAAWLLRITPAAAWPSSRASRNITR